MKPKTISAYQACKIADGLLCDHGCLTFMDTEEMARAFRIVEIQYFMKNRLPFPPIMPAILLGNMLPQGRFTLAVDSFDTEYGPVLHIELEDERRLTHTYANPFSIQGFNLITCIAEFPVVFILGWDQGDHLVAGACPLCDLELSQNLYSTALRCAAATPQRDYIKALQLVKELVTNGNE